MSKQTVVIDFSPEGTVEAMHFDAFPLGFLGPMNIERASELKFDANTQKWAIHVANGQGGFNLPVEGATGFDTYEQARDTEVQWFQECRAKGCAPESYNGMTILAKIRACQQIASARVEVNFKTMGFIQAVPAPFNSGDLIAAMMRDGAGS